MPLLFPIRNPVYAETSPHMAVCLCLPWPYNVSLMKALDPLSFTALLCGTHCLTAAGHIVGVQFSISVEQKQMNWTSMVEGQGGDLYVELCSHKMMHSSINAQYSECDLMLC